jgi:AdoMet-dependent rRNA methyltransferase SPB1
MPKGSVIIGVDYAQIKPIKGTIAIKEDITTDKCRQALKKELKHMKAGCILNDGAANVGSAWNQDAYDQNGLVLMGLKVAVEWLAPGGTYVTKVFRSQDYNKLLYVLKLLFEKVNATKPMSSRNVSAEIFIVCQGYLAPDSVDPRILDPKCVFAEVNDSEGPQVDIFAPDKHKRERNGYEEDNVGLHKEFPLEAFVGSNDFLNVLGSYNTLVADKDSPYMTHKATTDEIKECFQDLKLLGKKEFRELIKWRKVMVAWRASQAPAGESEDEEGSGSGSGSGSDSELDEQTKLEHLASEVEERQFREKKRERRKRDKTRLKQRERQALNMDLPVDIDDIQQDTQLFAMDSIKSKAGLAAVDEADFENDETQAGVFLGSDVQPEGMLGEGEGEEDADGYQIMEKELDAQYKEYLARKGMLTKRIQHKNKLKTIGVDKPSAADAPNDDYVPDDLSDYGSDGEGAGGGAGSNPLVVKSREGEAGKDRVANMWFAQSGFAGLEDSDSDDGAPHQSDGVVPSSKRRRIAEPEAGGKAAKGKKERAEGAAAAAAASTLDLSNELDAPFDVDGVGVGGGDDDDSDDDADSEDDAGFEVVSAAAHAPKPLDTRHNLDAHGLALAAEMILRRKKRAIVDAAYNRYTFNDPEMPQWFGDEEDPHMKPAIPMTREMADDIKEREREINARPIKKVLEAKGRIKRKTEREKDKTTKRATAIAENTSMTTQEKAIAIRSLYGKARRRAKRMEDDKPTTVVGRGGKGAGRPNGVSGRYKVVDKRYRSDLAGQKRATQRQKSGRKGHRR